jgi:hypothetical protein
MVKTIYECRKKYYTHEVPAYPSTQSSQTVDFTLEYVSPEHEAQTPWPLSALYVPAGHSRQTFAALPL